MAKHANKEEVETAQKMTQYAVTPSDLALALEHGLSSRNKSGTKKKQANIMVWGAMGIGKTDVVKQVGKLWGARIVALHLPQYDPTDLKGIPVLVDGIVKWVPSSYLPQQKTVTLDDVSETTIDFNFPNAESVMVHLVRHDKSSDEDVVRQNDQMNGDMNSIGASITINKNSVVINGVGLKGLVCHIIDKAVIFLDELSAAVPEVQNAALQLVLDKRVGEYDVPLYTPIVAAGNRESDQAFVSPMSMPLCNRFMHLRLIPSLEDWKVWAINNGVNSEILGYLQWKQADRLFRFEPDDMSEGDCGFPTPRSWAMLSDQMSDINSLPGSIQQAIIAGFIGRATAHEFIEFRKVCTQLPSTDDILQGRPVVMPEGLGIGAQYSLAIALCHGIKRYHGMFYDTDIKPNEIHKQSKEWKTAVKSFCEFLDAELPRDLIMLAIHIIAHNMEISFATFKVDPEVFAKFVERHKTVLRKTL